MSHTEFLILVFATAALIWVQPLRFRRVLRASRDALEGAFHRVRTLTFHRPRTSKTTLTDPDHLTAWFDKRMCCPDCGSTSFFQGPRGGLATNMRCAGCRYEYNIAFDPFGMMVMYAERLTPARSNESDAA